MLLNTLDENTVDFNLWAPEHTYDVVLIHRDGKEVGCKFNTILVAMIKIFIYASMKKDKLLGGGDSNCI